MFATELPNMSVEKIAVLWDLFNASGSGPGGGCPIRHSREGGYPLQPSKYGRLGSERLLDRLTNRLATRVGCKDLPIR
jgi:hypothetical protein